MTHTDRVINREQEVYNVLANKDKGTGSQTMQALQDLGNVFMKRAENSESKY